MPAPALRTVRDTIAGLFPEIHIDETTPDLFFFKGAERMMPFATIVTRDTEFDGFSRLDADGAFRLNIGLDKAGFQALFPQLGSRKALETAVIDYAARDVFMPNPHYGRMHWVSVVNPDTLWEPCRALLATAHANARG